MLVHKLDCEQYAPGTEVTFSILKIYQEKHSRKIKKSVTDIATFQVLEWVVTREDFQTFYVYELQRDHI